MAFEFKQERRIEFAETDMAGIVHFANYFRFMEATEHEFFRSLGFTLHTNEDGVMQGWARVHAECDYQRPLRYGERVEIQLIVREKGSTSLGYEFRFRLADGGPEVARGALRVVYVSRGPGDERMRASEIPAEIAATVEVAPRELHQSTEG